MPFSIYHSQGPTYHGKLDAQGKTPCYKQLPDGHATVEVGQPRDLDQKIQSQRQQLKKVLHQIIQKTRQHYDQHDHDSTLLHRLGQYAQGFKQGVEDLAVSTWHATETVGHVFQNTAVTDFQIAQWLATGDEAVQHKLAQKGETITHTLQHLSGDAQQGYHLLKLLMTDHDTRQLLIQFLKQYWAALPEDQQMQDIGEVVGNLGGVGILLGILGKVARFTPKALPTSAHSAMNQAAQKANKLAELLKQRQQAKKLNKAELNKKHSLIDHNQLAQVREYPLQPKRIRKGTNGRVAVIGRSMGDDNEKGVKHFAEKLKQQGYDVEIFDGDIVPNSAIEDFQNRIDIKKKLYGHGWLTSEELEKTEMYKANKKWAEKLVEEDYTVVDLGNPYQKEKSPFYELEQTSIFGENNHG